MTKNRLLAAIAALIFTAAPARADIFVVVNLANPVRSLSSQEVSALYLGRSRTFPNGDFALVFDQVRDSPVRERFLKLVTGMSVSQANTYWSRLMFSGQVLPPQALPSEQAILNIVRRNPSAIGYLGVAPKDPALRVVLEVRE